MSIQQEGNLIDFSLRCLDECDLKSDYSDNIVMEGHLPTGANELAQTVASSSNVSSLSADAGVVAAAPVVALTTMGTGDGALCASQELAKYPGKENISSA